jgi:nucleotide-binding universal stress UspA family protein
MRTFERILVPTDFSTCSHLACEMAMKLAMTYGSSIELIHVHELLAAWPGFVIPDLVLSMPNEPSKSLDEFVQTRALRALEHIVEKLQRAGVTHVRHRTESGDPGAIIVRIAEEEKFDLIVMGTHGRKGIERLMMGSVAERIVRQAKCPVLTIRAREDAAPLERGDIAQTVSTRAS